MKLIFQSFVSKYFFKIVKKTIESNKMLSYGDKVLVAVSGGSDSMALLYALFSLSFKYNITLGVAHFNHELREKNSNIDAFFVELNAKKLGIPFYNTLFKVYKIKNNFILSLEDSARRVRYAFLKKVMISHSFNKLAVAHHMDDNVELILMNMIRGSGLAGVTGMVPVRKKNIVRPFFRNKKREILNFLLDNKIYSLEDRSNESFDFIRNKVRHQLIPFLNEYFYSSVVNNLSCASLILSKENEYIESVVKFEYKRALIYYNANRVSLSIFKLKELHVSILRRLIRMVLCFLLGSLRQITYVHTDNVLALIKSELGVKFIFLPNYVKVTKVYGKLNLEIVFDENIENKNIYNIFIPDFVIKENNIFPLILKNEKYCFSFSLMKFSKSISLDHIGKDVALFDLKFLKFPIFIRYSAFGDRFKPLGMVGSQKVRRYLSNKKVPFLQRNKIVIEDENGIIWLVKYVVSDHTKITKTTKYILVIRYFH